MLTVAVVVAGYADRGILAIKIKSVYVRTPPKAANPEPSSTRKAQVFSAAAPWALSAVPECLIQTEKASGSSEYVDRRLPAGFQKLLPGVRLQYGDCTIIVRANDVFMLRGKDAFRIPAPAELYRKGRRLALLYGGARGAELRLYAPSNIFATP